MIEPAALMTRPPPTEPSTGWAAWIPLLLKLALLLAGAGGSYLGGEHQGGVAAFPAAWALAEEAVTDELEDRSFRALEAEAARDDRVPASVVSHLAQVISRQEADLRACRLGE